MRRKAGIESSAIITFPIENLNSRESYGFGASLGQGNAKKGRRSIVDMSRYKSTPFVPHVSALEGLFVAAKVDAALGSRVRAVIESGAFDEARPASSLSTAPASSTAFPHNFIRFHVQTTGGTMGKNVVQSEFSKGDILLRIYNNYDYKEFQTLLSLICGSALVNIKRHPAGKTEKDPIEPDNSFIFVTILKTDLVSDSDLEEATKTLRTAESFDALATHLSTESLEASEESLLRESSSSLESLSLLESSGSKRITYLVNNASKVLSFTYAVAPTTVKQLHKLFQANARIGKHFFIQQDGKCFRDTIKKVTPKSLEKPFQVTTIPALSTWLFNHDLEERSAPAIGYYNNRDGTNMCMYNALSIAYNVLHSYEEHKSGGVFKEMAMDQLRHDKNRLLSLLGKTNVDIKIEELERLDEDSTFATTYPLYQGMSEYNKTANSYYIYVMLPNTMGGEVELRCISRALGENYVIIVYRRLAYYDCSEKLIDNEARWCTYYSNGNAIDALPSGKSILRLIYGASHYDALVSTS